MHSLDIIIRRNQQAVIRELVDAVADSPKGELSPKATNIVRVASEGYAVENKILARASE